MNLRTQYNYDADADAIATGLECKDPSKAQQHMAADADINNIVQRYLNEGVLPEIPLPPDQDDFAEVFDFQSAMNVIALAQQSFGRLRADVRKRFSNDPAEFVAFCTEEKDGKLVNLAEMEKLGLAIPKPAATIPPAVPPTGEVK